MPTIETITSRGDLDPLQGQWDEIVAADTRGIGGLDATASHAWITALIDSRLREGDWWVLVERDGARINAILPLYRTCRGGPAASADVSLISELHGGRNGFIARPEHHAAARRLVRTAIRDIASIGSLSLTLCEGSLSHALFDSELGRHFIYRRRLSTCASPYIELPPSFESYLAARDREFIDVLRRRTKRLHAQGEVELRTYRGADSVPELMEAIHEVEARSWKEAAGTSITTNEAQARFYDVFVPRAAEAGMLESMVMYLSGRPIAYQLAVRLGDTVLGLKTSFDNSLRSVSAGTVMGRAYVEHVHSLGCKVFDLMGEVEPYKMKWTDLTYRRTTYRCFPRTVAGLLELARSSGFSLVRKTCMRIRTGSTSPMAPGSAGS